MVVSKMLLTGIMMIAISGCGVPNPFDPDPVDTDPPPPKSALAGTWQNSDGDILVINDAGTVVQEKFYLVILLACDGNFHVVAPGIEGRIAPYKITSDTAGSLTMEQHSMTLKDSGGTEEYTISGTGLLKSSREMSINWIKIRNTDVDTYSSSFTKTSD